MRLGKSLHLDSIPIQLLSLSLSPAEQLLAVFSVMESPAASPMEVIIQSKNTTDKQAPRIVAPADVAS